MINAHLKKLSVEELANTVTHGLGLVLSIAGFIALVVLTGLRGDPMLIVGCVVYGLSLVVLYGASTMYHSTMSLPLKKRLQIIDHCCIYLLIAGSYTPFGLVIMDEWFGRELMMAFWGIAILGIVVKLIVRDRFPAINVISYVVMGWLGVFAVQPLFNALGIVPVVLTVAGGVAYTLGVIFFPWTSIKHHHAIFHIFILLGSILQYAAVILYIVPFVNHG